MIVITRRRFLAGRCFAASAPALALPLLDSMVPAFASAQGAGTSRSSGSASSTCRTASSMKNWTPAAEGGASSSRRPCSRSRRIKDRLLVLTGLNSKPPAGLTGANIGVHARAATRFLTDVPPKHTNNAEIHAGISMDQMRREGARASRRSWRRSSSRSRGATSPARATSATAAPTRTRSPGARRRRRCRWRTIRASSSSGCSATAAAPMPSARLARIREGSQPARFGHREGRTACRRRLGAARSRQADRVSRRDSRHRAPHSARRSSRAPGAAAGRSAGRHSGRVRRSRQADVRSAGARLSVRSDARHHVHDGPRDQRPHLPGDRRPRGAPSDVAPQQRSGEAGQPGQDQHLSRDAVRVLRRRSCSRRPTATARCSIT